MPILERHQLTLQILMRSLQKDIGILYYRIALFLLGKLVSSQRHRVSIYKNHLCLWYLLFKVQSCIGMRKLFERYALVFIIYLLYQ